MKIWKVEINGTVTPLEVPSDEFVHRATEMIGAPIDLTRAIWNGRFMSMAVDDEGPRRGLPVNPIATTAYLQACKPGTDYQIVGTAVIFDDYQADSNQSV